MGGGEGKGLIGKQGKTYQGGGRHGERRMGDGRRRKVIWGREKKGRGTGERERGEAVIRIRIRWIRNFMASWIRIRKNMRSLRSRFKVQNTNKNPLSNPKSVEKKRLPKFQHKSTRKIIFLLDLIHFSSADPGSGFAFKSNGSQALGEKGGDHWTGE